jgi:hypothetical protein
MPRPWALTLNVIVRFCLTLYLVLGTRRLGCPGDTGEDELPPTAAVVALSLYGLDEAVLYPAMLPSAAASGGQIGGQ